MNEELESAKGVKVSKVRNNIEIAFEDDEGLYSDHQKGGTKLKDHPLMNEELESSNSKAEAVSVSGEIDEVACDDVSCSGVQDFSKDAVSGENSTEEHGKSGGASGNEQTEVQRDHKQNSSSKIRNEAERLQEKKLIEAVSAETSELESPEEFELLKAAAEMAFDDSHPTEFYLERLNEQIDSRKRSLLELESQWDDFRNHMEEKKRSLEESLYANKPEAQEKLKILREVELERQSVLSETQKRVDEYSKLSVELERQPEVASRRSYIERVKEITKNSRKQDADIERILKETRELQLESNSIQERLHRTYAIVDDKIFREAKKDSAGRQAYRLLTSIHESFEQVSNKILATDRVRREITEYDKKLAAMASQSLNVDKPQADLDAIIKENEYLEQATPKQG